MMKKLLKTQNCVPIVVETEKLCSNHESENMLQQRDILQVRYGMYMV